MCEVLVYGCLQSCLGSFTNVIKMTGILIYTDACLLFVLGMPLRSSLPHPQGRPPPGAYPAHLQDPRWNTKGPHSVTSYSNHPTKLQTFTGSNSNNSADSGFRESGSDREVSDVDAEMNPDLLLKSGSHLCNPAVRTHHAKFMPHNTKQRQVMNNSCHSNPAGCLGKNCSCQQQSHSNQQRLLSNQPKQLSNQQRLPNNQPRPAIKSKGLYGTSNYRIRPAENIQLNDLSPQKENSYVLNLQDTTNNSDTGTMCSDVVV